MKNEIKTLMGISITVLVFFISYGVGQSIKIPIEFIPLGFSTHSMMLVLSGISIYYFQSKGLLIFKFKRIRLKVFFIAILTSIIAFIIVKLFKLI